MHPRTNSCMIVVPNQSVLQSRSKTVKMVAVELKMSESWSFVLLQLFYNFLRGKLKIMLY